MRNKSRVSLAATTLGQTGKNAMIWWIWFFPYDCGMYTSSAIKGYVQEVFIPRCGLRRRRYSVDIQEIFLLLIPQSLTRLWPQIE